MLPIIIDGVDYTDAVIIDSLVEDAELIEGIGHMTRQDGTEWYDVIGTRFTRTITVRRKTGADRTLWNGFYGVLASPVDVHSVRLGNRNFAAHITTVSRELKDYTSDGNEMWADTYTVAFEGTTMEVS